MIARQKIMEREYLSFDEKMDIAKKSNQKCCKCGKEVYFGYGATIDHFIPLSKGGTNRDINLIMLCEKCNKEKGEKIVTLGHYTEYLKKEHKKKLSDYFQSYVESFDYADKNNFLACDEYSIRLTMGTNGFKQKGNKHRKKQQRIRTNGNRAAVKRAAYCDLDKILTYYIKYLKKYGLYEDGRKAKEQVGYWFKEGCMYYFESAGEIGGVMAIELKDDGPYPFLKYLQVSLFVYYNNAVAQTIADAFMHEIPFWIMFEQDLTQLPVTFVIAKDDKLAVMFMRNFREKGDFRIESASFRMERENGKMGTDDEEKNKTRVFLDSLTEKTRT